MRKVDRTKEPSLCLQGSDTMTYTYDAQGNLTRSVLEYYGYEQARSDHTYNNFDRLTEVRDNYGITEYTYDADGRRTSKTRNGVTEQYIWDGDQLVVKLGTERITQFTLSTSKGADVRMPKLVEGQTYGLTVNGASYTAKAKKTVGEDDGPIQITRARPDDTEIPVLPPVTGKTRILLEFGPVSMEMEVNENPTTDGLVNVYVIGPANTAIALYDGDPALGTATYIRGLSLVAAVRDGVRTYYHYTAHGDVVQLTNSSGTVTKNYTYDAFGVEQDASDGDANPFRYCGEQYDSETGNYYLRARYYSPEVGRFTQEDPIMDGLNWYTYCAGNPVAKSDPTGLFGRNTKLGPSQKPNADVVIMQRQLVKLGYLDMKEGGWGYFGPKTLDAVNRYKDDNGLWNFGEYAGIVGETTWTHMGLKIDNDYEKGANLGSPEMNCKGMYVEANGPNLKRGINLGNVEAGVEKLGGDYQYGSWETKVVSGEAAAGISLDYVGVNVEGSLFKAEGGVKIPIPFTDKSLYLGAEGNAFGVGAHSYWSKEEGRFKIGATLLFGGGFSIGLDDR